MYHFFHQEWFKKWGIRLLLVIALAVRLGALVATVAFGLEPSPPGDPHDYRLLGLNILEGRYSMDPTSPYTHDLLRTPGYPIFLALTFLVDHRGYVAILLQIISAIVVGWWFYRILIQRVSVWLALLFTAIWLFDPMGLFTSLQTWSESMYVFCLSYVLFSFLHQERPQRSWWQVIPLGLVYGCAVSIRPHAILWLPAFFIFAYLNRFSWRQVVLFCFPAGLFVVVWMMRGFLLVGQPVLSSTTIYNKIFFLGAQQSAQAHAFTQRVRAEKDRSILTVNGRSSIRPWAYTAEAYPELQAEDRRLMQEIGMGGYLRSQLMCAPQYWYPYWARVGDLGDRLSQKFFRPLQPVLRVLDAFVLGMYGLCLVLLLVRTDRSTRLQTVALVSIPLLSSLLTYCIQDIGRVRSTVLLVLLLPMVEAIRRFRSSSSAVL